MVSLNSTFHLNAVFLLHTEAVVQRCSKKFRKILRKKPVPESLFDKDKVAGLRPAIFKKRDSGTGAFL